MSKKQALVLGGGGSRGAYEAGCWQTLHEAGFKPDLVVGTSAGALNGAMIVAGGEPEDLRRWWTSVRPKDVIRARRDVWRIRRWRGLKDLTPLGRLLAEHLPLEDLHASPMEFMVTAVDIETGQEVAFSGRELRIEHLMASCALIPGIPPVRIDGRTYVDGGHWTPFPLRRALEDGATKIHALLHDPIEPHPEPAPWRLGEMLRRVSDITWHGRQSGEMEALRLRTRLPKRDPEYLPPFDLMIHAPEPPLTNVILQFDPDEAAGFYERGRQETRGRLAAEG